MKRAFISFAVFLVSLTAFGQKDTISIQQFFEQIQQVQNSFTEKYEKKDWKSAEKPLLDGIALFNRLSEKEQKEFLGMNPQILSTFLYYNLACVYSLENQKKNAVDAFEKSVEFGYKDYAHAKVDTDLDNIRKEKRFVNLMKQLEEKSFLSILKKAGKYQTENTDSFPKFTYQSSDNYNLKNVRATLKLDSIAGNSDEISKILNVLHWAHNTIRHDGNNNGNCEFDAIDLYNYHKATGRGINCRRLAIFLNECYLSLGIPSRFITCFPNDSTDNDCHVINSVYCDSLQKWIWIDPTFNAYVKDENGNFLGIEEVREHLIAGKPLVLNEDANWNNEQKQTKENYLENYMTKNLYWLQCPADSKFNAESPYRNTNGKYISLVPSGFKVWDKPYMAKSLETTDVNYFWQKP